MIARGAETVNDRSASRHCVGYSDGLCPAERPVTVVLVEDAPFTHVNVNGPEPLAVTIDAELLVLKQEVATGVTVTKICAGSDILTDEES